MRDTRLKGLLLRVQPSGVMTWNVEFGRGKRIGLGRVDAIKSVQARDEAKIILSNVYAGKDPMAARRAERTHTLRSYIDHVYGPWAENNIRTHKGTLRRLRGNFPELFGRKLMEITPWLVEKWRMRRLKEGAKPSTVNRDLDDLKSCLHKAVLWSHIETHPIQSVRRSCVDSMPVARFLSDEERERLFGALNARENRIRAERARANQWRAARNYDRLPDLNKAPFADHLKPMVVVSLNTGMRSGEITNLNLSDVDLERAIITIHGHSAKSGRTRYIPLNAEALTTLIEW